jgi:hypothetical protein
MSEILKRLRAFQELKGKKVVWKLDKKTQLAFLEQKIKSMESSSSITTFIYHLCDLCYYKTGYKADKEKDKICANCPLGKISFLDEILEEE